MEEKKRLAWFILLRVIVISVFLVSTIILTIQEPDGGGNETLPGFLRLILATYLFSLVSLVILRYTDKFNQTLTYAQIIWDVLLVTILILLTGGMNSPYSFLYILSIINASVVLARREAIYTASLCAILYGTILDFQFYGKLSDLGLSQLQSQQHGGNVFYTVFINILAFYLTAFLTGYLAERARVSESALQKKQIDYEELKRLNSAIVSSLDSGLLTLNLEGKLRVFNRYATELTGITQEQAYDRSLRDIIPGISLELTQQGMPRKEIEYEPVGGNKIILGYKTAPLLDKEGNGAGIIVALQDITQFKMIEAELKRSDKLAAIGELSARIAHEIRNPLASISGSVQLIAEGGKVDPNDRKLLEIVLRETESLNLLITGFLAYARPTVPTKTYVSLYAFVGDLLELLNADPRFDKVDISRDFDKEVVLFADRGQFQQVFWNLFLNAAESMSWEGSIKVTAKNSHEGHRGKMLKISLSDTGKGISRDEKKRVFEPFFTTKPAGTGLGLATVYRIIEAHDGAITIDSSVGKGTTFTVSLPVGV